MIVASRLPRRRQGRVLFVVLALLFAGLLVAGAVPRLAQSKARAAERAQVNAAPTVFTETVRADTTSTPLELPASVTGLHETPIFARANGFVRALRVDIGSTVRAGDTLLLLDMPEVREQARQAAAVVEQAEASAALAATTLTRWQSLAQQGVVTPQELDERQAQANVADAALRGARANVASLREVLRFGAVLAPFAGVVSARTVDLGALVVAGAAAAARPLLTLIQTDTLRVMLQVPQSAASRVRAGLPVRVMVRETGDSAIAGVVARTAGAIDPATRTLLTEVHVINRTRRLLPGMFAQVAFVVPAGAPSLRIPAIALIVRGEGTLVARVRDNVVQLVPVTLGRDFGTSVEVLDGVAAGDALVVNPAESLSDGLRVRALARGAGKTGGGAAR
ncbi:efflux RND transporter periplasmic adaptor subunit [Gemmatimonas sp.]|jgi:RND family efflux transporter MFP subunit|uniref:efflux RND transporter periplasmic adaptor subunit n=1 Tax=Gemmatimonas sp. TaxID=1962908 RepID=UPI0025C5CB39|nr:efflux RND transporter periplasmic adaptor subunit [Gemmatimonas sp.]MCA2985638.1 efflux RND transporter periplasmic adaptor subunit [Gemmatimonas sp.]MCA2987834.1 efflux RND transporter periplasmic adaptor subunit [Gemmatimonas sp.]MCA2993429.1 efflux RND transporter periplasmic adaptor subunit [Gemmatimonas sp.]MCE2955386.1 efflux RND transporter periplasmic adaptor subunit [Gemmatimonas sp.]